MSGEYNRPTSYPSYINPDRVNRLGLHHLVGETAGSSKPTPNPQSSYYDSSKDDRDRGGHDYHNNRNDFNDRDDYSHRTRGGRGSSPHRSDKRRDHGRRGGNSNRNPLPPKDIFGYDDRVRPRPRSTKTKWDLPPTQKQIEYYQRYLQQTAYPPNIQKGTPRVVTELNPNMLEERDAVDVTGNLGETEANKATLSILLGDAFPGARDSAPSSIPLPALRPGAILPTNTHDRQACRIYVGGVDHRVNEASLRDFLTKTLLSIEERPPPEDPQLEQERGIIAEVQLRPSYAFVEFYNRLDAEMALSMDGVMFGDIHLRIKCPKEMVAYYQQHPPRRFTVPGAVPSTVENGPNKIFLGSIPREMTDGEVREIVESIGKLSAFNLVKDTDTGLSKGYAFFTYVEPDLVHSATSILHGYKLPNGRYLTCAPAGVQPPPLPAAMN